jgi:hypothetical protein
MVMSLDENLRGAKYDEFVPEALLRRMWARSNAEPANQVRSVAVALLGAGA